MIQKKNPFYINSPFIQNFEIIHEIFTTSLYSNVMIYYFQKIVFYFRKQKKVENVFFFYFLFTNMEIVVKWRVARVALISLIGSSCSSLCVCVRASEIKSPYAARRINETLQHKVAAALSFYDPSSRFYITLNRTNWLNGSNLSARVIHFYTKIYNYNWTTHLKIFFG